jgi:deoxynucleoside triphosphate triphosphohydrolase SAMHD1
VDWCHEKMSLDLLDVLIDDNTVDIDPDMLRMVKTMITGVPTSEAIHRRFLYEIVANKRNGIDVDKV